MLSRRSPPLALLGSALVAALFAVPAAFIGCKPGGSARPSAPKVDALFLGEPPAVVPEELEPELKSMGIRQLYVAGASLSAKGTVTGFPPPPAKLRLPVIFAVLGEVGAEAQLSGSGRDLAGLWFPGLQKALREAREWASVRAVHIHLPPRIPDSSQIAADPGKLDKLKSEVAVLAEALEELGKRIGLPVSTTVAGGVSPAVWKPLSGIVEEVLVLSLGRRPETHDQMAVALKESEAKEFPVPFKVLVIPGGYGRGGSNRRILDGEIDKLSEDANVNFTFGKLLSADPGNIYVFSPAKDRDPARSALRDDGGEATFHVIAQSDVVGVLAAAGRWGSAPLTGRVFWLGGLPQDGHLLAYPAIRAILTGAPIDPNLTIELASGSRTRTGAELVLRVTNGAASPTELSHWDNWITIRIEGGVLASVANGDFDRSNLRIGTEPNAPQALPGKANVVRLYENFFAPGESNLTGPLRVTGADARVLVSYHLALPDGRVVEKPEVEISLAQATPEPKPEPKPKRR